MGRILAIDYGTKRTGLAVTDPLQIISSPLAGIPSIELIGFLTKYFSQEPVERVVVGWPTKDDGSNTNNTQNVLAFINLFKKKFPDMPVVLQDEWGTSKMAIKSMIAGGVKKKDRRDKNLVDKVAAVLILQSYMETTA
jgi:putative Holliday junction resolvase